MSSDTVAQTARAVRWRTFGTLPKIATVRDRCVCIAAISRTATVTLALVALAFTPTPALAARGVLAGEVTKLSKSAGARTVQAIDARTGSVVAVDRLGRSTSFRLSLPTGPYLLIADARTARGSAFGAVSTVQDVRAGRTARVTLRATASAAASRPSLRPTARAATLVPGSVVSIMNIVVDAAPGAGRGLSLDNAVLGEIFDGCSDMGVRFVDTHDEIIDTLEKEAAFRASGRSADTFEFRPLAAQYQLSGQGSISADGQVRVELNLIDLATNGVVRHWEAQGRSLDDAIGEVTDEFSEEECGVPIKSRCPRLNGKRLACVTSIVETGKGGSATQIVVDPPSCPSPNGYSRIFTTNLSWFYMWNERAILHALPGGIPGPWEITGDHRVDAECGLNNEHCSAKIFGSRGRAGSIPGWNGQGKPGRWRITIPALAFGPHQTCAKGASDDPVVRESAVVKATLKGKPGRPRPRTQVVPFSLSETLPCGEGCKDSYKLSGRIVIRGEW